MSQSVPQPASQSDTPKTQVAWLTLRLPFLSCLCAELPLFDGATIRLFTVTVASN